MVAVLINAGANVEEVNHPNKWTPLHVAATHNRVEVISLMLDKEPWIDRKTKTNLTALSIAIMLKHAESTKLLVSRGASLNCAKKLMQNVKVFFGGSLIKYDLVIDTSLK